MIIFIISVILVSWLAAPGRINAEVQAMQFISIHL